jgi:hypothetical protein
MPAIDMIQLVADQIEQPVGPSPLRRIAFHQVCQRLA